MMDAENSHDAFGRTYVGYEGLSIRKKPGGTFGGLGEKGAQAPFEIATRIIGCFRRKVN